MFKSSVTRNSFGLTEHSGLYDFLSSGHSTWSTTANDGRHRKYPSLVATSPFSTIYSPAATHVHVGRKRASERSRSHVCLFSGDQGNWVIISICLFSSRPYHGRA